jgi:hypothetical protein
MHFPPYCRASAVLLAALAVGCARYRPPGPHPVRQASQVAASFGRSWDAGIDYFAEYNIPIRTIERASGLIVSERRPEEVPLAAADCGSLGRVSFGATHIGYNVVVRGDSTRSSIKVTPIFMFLVPEREYERVCASRGVFEQDLEAAIKARAEGRVAPRASSSSAPAPSSASPRKAPQQGPDRRSSAAPAEASLEESALSVPLRALPGNRPPSFPDIDLGAPGKSYTVRVEFIVGRDGRVDPATFRNLSPEADVRLVEAARVAVLSWSFEPAWEGQGAVRVRVQRQFEFIDR